MKRPLRVLLLVDSLESQAGTENHIIDLVRGIDRSRVEVFMACLEDGPRLRSLASFCTPLVFPIVKVFSPHGVREMRRLRATIRRERIDIVQTFIIRSAIAGVLAAAGAAPILITTRRNAGYWYTPKLLWLFRMLDKFTTRVLTNCELVRRVTIERERIPAGKVDVLYNGVDMARFGTAQRAQLALPEGALVVGIVANYRPVKNLPLFLRSARKVALENSKAVFVLVGRGPLQAELERLASDLGIADRVIFTDEKGDVAALLPLLDVACLTSDSEGFPNAILEYMAAGRPVVATAVGGVPEAVEEGRTGLLVAPGDEDALAQAVLKLLDDGALRLEMGQRGLERCRTLFELGDSVRRQQDYWEKLGRLYNRN